MIGEDIPHLVRTAQELAAPSDRRDRRQPRLPRPQGLQEERRRRPPARSRADRAPSSPPCGRPCPASSPSRCGSASRTRANFDRILDIVNENRHRPVDRARPDGARDVPQRGALRQDRPGRRARSACPVLANGNVTSAARAAQVVRETRRRRRDDRPPRDPQPLDLPPVPRSASPGAPPGAGLAPGRPRIRRAALPGHAPPGNSGAGPREQDEEVPQFCRPGRGPRGRLSPRHAPGGVGGGALRGLRPAPAGPPAGRRSRPSPTPGSSPGPTARRRPRRPTAARSRPCTA